MFRRLSQTCLTTIRSRSTNYSTQPQSKEKWDLYASVLVERLPIVSKSLNSLETDFQKLLWQTEFENSLKSDHELQHEKDLIQAELIKKGEVEIEFDDSASKQTAQDLKDSYIEEAKKFQLASRETPDDKTNNLKSIKRRLEDTLYLLVEQKVGKNTLLLLPQGIRQEGETMRQTAERVLLEQCGDQLNVTFYGNAPCGFYKYKYPTAVRGESIGAKVFFFRSTLKSGNVSEASKKKFEWLDQFSLGKRLNVPAYSESIQRMLL
ncbi:39S ribosomal protein L46, mitochondrial [Episyrphus balteatus]|uniref:39S ribosomal protein L46, mitochondrial n=1 Tax=Episyrphus balteatus TaxID=286459 RepID=UPI00248667FA|nr:39S ribosomal protein L46, mitochondrial [Episyrphus balteatus]